MARFSALLDACVLVPIAQADCLLRLAEVGLFRPLWSREILDEVVAAVETIHPTLADGRAAARTSAMDRSFIDACVTDWESLVDSIDLPDPDDRHVVAAAIRGRADVLVTNNLRDFPPDRLQPHEIEVQSPDTFLLNQLDLDPERVMTSLRKQAEAARRPEVSLSTLLHHLSRCGLPGFAEAAHAQLWRA